MKKRILCALLMLCLLLTVLPVAAYAAGTQLTEEESNDYPSNADNIGNGYTILGNSTQYDLDYFKFTLSKDSTVTVLCASELPLYVGIMDSAAKEFEDVVLTTRELGSGTYDGELSTELKAGTYYLLTANPVESYTHNVYTVYIEWKSSSSNPFTDVSENAAYYDAVLWGNSKGIVSGFTATEFRPNNTCTRAQVVTFLWRAAGSPEPTSTNNPFKDVSAVQANGKANPFYKAILWGVEKGITSGYNDGTFRPNDTVTRAQFVTFLWRYEGKPTSSTALTFNDASTIAKGYRDAVAWGVEKGVIAGYGDNTFRPNATCTRWQVVLFMWRDMKDKL